VLPGTGQFVNSGAPEKARTPVSDVGDITLNFVDVDIREAIRSVLGDVLHLNYAIDPKLQSTITVQTSHPLPRDAVLPAFQEVLRASGLALVESAGIWRVVPLEEAARGSTAAIVVGGGSAPIVGGGVSVNVHILPMKFVAAAAMRETLEPFLPKGAVIQVDPARNLLIVTGARQDLTTIDNLVNSFDVNWLSAMSFAIYPLEAGSPRTIVRNLNTVFRAGGNSPLAGTVRFEPLEGMNAVLIVSPQRAYLDEARKWVERLDRGSDDEKPRLYEYHVQNSRAVDLAKVLSQLLTAGAVHTVQPQTALGTGAVQLSSSASGSPTSGGLPSNSFSNSNPPGSTMSGSNMSGSNMPGLNMSGNPSGGAAIPGSPAGVTDNATASEPSPDAASQSLDAALGSALGGASPGGDLEFPKVKIVADEKNNALVIFARPRDYRSIEDAIQRLDVVPMQVLIEATIVEVTLNQNLQYGLQWFFSRGANKFEQSNALSGTSAATDIVGSFPGFNYVLGGTNTRLVLSALSDLTHIDVISAPEVLVLDHQTATLQVGDQVPTITQTSQSVTNTDAPVVNSVQYINTGVILQVTPRVNNSGLVMLDIDQAVSDVKATTTSTINSPTISQRRIVTSAVMQDGQSIALGGLILENRNGGKSGIPILSDLPVVGSLFGTTTQSRARTELLVLLTPKIIRNATEAHDATAELRGRLNSIEAVLSRPH
jgi:general secretion pathway protein D